MVTLGLCLGLGLRLRLGLAAAFHPTADPQVQSAVCILPVGYLFATQVMTLPLGIFI